MKWIGILIVFLAVHRAAADAAHADFERGLIFPNTLGQMPFEKLEQFDTEELGYILFYSNGTFSVELAVFNHGRQDIPDGPSSRDVKALFETLELQFEKREDEELIDNFRRRGFLVVPKNAPVQLANTVFQYNVNRPGNIAGKQQSVPRINSVYATGSRKHFIQVQFRFDVAENRKARVMAEEMARQLSNLLAAAPSEEDLLLAACDAVINNPADYAGKAAAQHVMSKAGSLGNLSIYDAFFVWQEGHQQPENADLLLAAYFAGMLKAVLPQQLESGGGAEAFIAMMQAYDNMRARDQIKSIPKLDEWSKAKDRSTLYQKLLVEFGYIAP